MKHAEGADLSKKLHVPRWIDGVLNDDRVAYTLHVCFGRTLNWLGATPSTAGMESLKAAAHARTEGSLARVVQGLRETRSRSRDVDLNAALEAAVVQASTCCGRDAKMRRRQLAALEQAGMRSAAHDDVLAASQCARCGPSAKDEVSNDR